MIRDLVPADIFRPLVLDDAVPADAAELARIREVPGVSVIDLRPAMRSELARLKAAPEADPADDRWVYYPWRSSLVAIVGAPAFRAIRQDRNRNKVTIVEQRELRGQAVGVIGQSAGHEIAYVIALEGTCGLLRIADFDTVELSNLNRIPGGLFDIGLNKCVVTGRRIAELDPYLPVEIFPAGVDESSIDEFLTGLSVVVEVCDSLDVKLAAREAARRHRIPVLMETNDRGLFDVERFDLEPDRPPFHGLLGETMESDLRGLSNRDKAPHVMRILDPNQLSARLAASLTEIDETVTTWPQLGSDVGLGAAIIATAVRRIGLDQALPSGRIRIDLERELDGLCEPDRGDRIFTADAPLVESDEPHTPIARILHSIERAPSGGNAQPWAVHVDGSVVHLAVDPARTSGMDIGFRGSAVALGAALYNARVAAAAQGLLGTHEIVLGGTAPVSALLRLGARADPELAADYPGMLTRATNRHLGDGRPLDPEVLDALSISAAAEGSIVHGLVDRAALGEVAELLAESDRVRYLTPRLHAEMFGELRWPADDLRTGLDLRTMELAADEQAKLDIGARADVMAYLRDWSGGVALGDYAYQRISSGSALIAITCPAGIDADLTDYVRGGSAVERVWIAAQKLGLAVQPMSPVFLYARDDNDLRNVSAGFTDTLASINKRFSALMGIPGHETVTAVLRLSYAPAPTVRSARLPVLGPGN
ncbi:Rv1355c family protein [Nocardia salmonicida]|uniref:Rv1355c family protein n=1 Tax=Nocardia salmonicida TaxID=53431 RepID=UPI0007A531E8|nr:Rv1355c family protein [Nocardia salmonicida]